MRNAVVAGSRLHAAAMISWFKLDPEGWVPIAYGEKLAERYDEVRLVRPLAGITDEHYEWITQQLIPRATSCPTVIPHTWRVLSQEDNEAETLLAPNQPWS